MASELNIDTKFLRNLEKVDESLQKIVKSTNDATAAFEEMLRKTDSFDIIAKLQSNLSKLVGKKVEIDVDGRNVKSISETMDRLVEQVKSLAGTDLFDTSKIYENEKGIVALESHIANINKVIKDLKKNIGNIDAEKYVSAPFVQTTQFVAPINPRTQKEYGKNTNAYRNAYSNYEEEVAKQREAYEERERLEEETFNREKEIRKKRIEDAIHALIEKKAIATEELEWQKMTFAERLEYTQSSLNKILKAEKKNVDDVRKEYKQLLAEQIDIMSKRQKLEGYEDSREKQAAEKEYDIQFERRNARRIEIEREYGDSVVDIAENAQRKILDIEMARIKKAEEAEFERYATSPSGALNLASKATTINQMKDAQKYIQAARANVDVSDTETIKKLNDEYTRLRMTIENLTTAEKNEQTLQPTLKNEYARLLVELDKINKAKEKAANTSAFKNGEEESVRSMNSLLERENDVKAKMAKIEEAARVKTEERIKLEKELAFWTEKRDEARKKINERDIRDAKKGKGSTEANNYLYADEMAQKKQQELSLIDGYESALDEVIRKHEAARAMESIALTEKTEKEKAEIANRILKEKLSESSKYGSISSDSANRMISVTDNSQNVAEEERAIKKLEEARKHLNQNDVDYQETLERLNKKIAEHTHNIKMATDAQYAENQAKKQAREVNTTYDGALNFSRNTQSINEQIQAIKYLKEAREKLNKYDFGSENEYKKAVKDITDEINRQKKSLDELEGKTKKTNSELSTLSRRLIAAFSINAISNYVSKVVQLRGEFALQQKALAAIVQDQKAANKLWEQTVSLALKSPYRVKQLVTYTKQLAAYRVETQKLHDTTKMLADVSAGLGVDMERLILAYGQVKAANYLRGTELRQFSEAGINILGELATYFEETRGKAFSVAEVFDMVSKRAVKFEDVDEVFKRLTGSSGIFFKMQEKQAETVAGQLSNLRDAYEIMLNDIGKQNEGTIISVISSARYIVAHWREIATIVKPILETLVVGMTAWRVQMALSSKSLKTFGLYMKQFYILATQGKNAMIAFSKASSISSFAPFALAIGAAVAALGNLILNFYKYKQAISEINKKNDEAVRQVNEINMEFIQASKQQNPYKPQIDALKKLISLAEKKYKMTIEVDIAKLNPEDIEKTFNEIKNSMMSDELFISAAMKTFASREEGRINPFGDEIVEDMRDFSNSIQSLDEYISNNQANIVSKLKDNYTDLTNEEKDALEELSKGFDASAESQEEYLQRVRNTLGELLEKEKERLEFARYHGAEGEYQKLASKINDIWGGTYYKLSSGIDTVRRQTKEATKEWYEFIKRVQGLEGLPKDELERKLKLVISETQLRNEWNDNVVRNINAWTEEYYREQKGITIKLNTPQISTMDNVLSAWQYNYNKLFKSYYGFDKIVDVGTTREDVIQRINGDLEKQKELVERIKKVGTGKGTAYEGYDLDEENRKLDELQKQSDWFGVSDKKKNEEQIKILNNRINLIKELNKEYVKLNEIMSSEKAQKTVAESYKDTFRKAFEDTGISLSSLVVNEKALSDLKEQSKKAGSTISESILSELEKLKETGTYIRAFDDEFLAAIKKREGFKAEVYTDAGGVKTQGYGETINIEEGKTWDKEKAELVLRDSLTKRYVAQLNQVLDNNKELVLTQKQYNAILDLTYQGGIGATKQLLSRVEDTQKGVEYIESIYEKIKKQVGEKSAERFGDAFIKKFKEAESIYERIAMMLEISNLTIKGSINKSWYAGMQKRSDERASMFRGDLAVSEQIKGIFQEVGSFDFTNLKGVVEELKKLAPLAKKEGKEAELSLSKAISKVQSEIDIQINVEEYESIKRKIEDMFGQYNLTIELKDAGFNSDLIKTFFNVPKVSIDNIRDEIKKMLGDSAKEISNDTSLIDAINKSTLSDKIKKLLLDNLSKVTKEERNALQKRLKQYIDYTKESLSEISKIRLEEARELQSVTDVINAEIKRVGKDTEEGKRLVGILETLRKSIKRNADEDAQKAEWENFKGSDMYTMMFEDIEYFGTKALGVLKTKLEEFKSSLKDLPVSDVKEIISQIEKIENVMIDRNPFKLLSETKTDLKKLPSEKELQQQFADSSMKVDEYQKELDAINAIIAAKNTILNTDKKSEDNIKSSAEAEKSLSEYTKKYGDYTQMSVTELNQMRAALEQNLNKEKEIANTSRKGLGLYKKSRQEYASAANKVQQIGQQVDNAFSATRDILSAVGVEADSVAGTLLEAGQNMTSLIFSAIEMQLQFKAMGVAANSALGVIGWIATALQVVAQLFTALFSIHDKKREKQIQKELDLVKKLEKEYKKLEKAMDEAYSVDAMKSSYDEAQKNLDAQIASYEKIIQLEKDKKKTDNDKLEEYQDKLEELREQKEELKREKVEDFGGNYDFRSVTREFVDAWLDAFRETGIGIDGLDEKFKELMQNIVVEQAVMTGASKILQPMLDSINKSLEDDFVLDSDELSEIEDLNEDARLRLDQFLKSLFGEGGVFSDYVNTEANGELDGLQKGIQGITEETAQIIEGYLNSIRFFVSEKYNLLSNFVSSFTNTEMENPIISQLKIIAVQTTSINTLLNSLTAPHPTQDGFGIKVVI